LLGHPPLLRRPAGEVEPPPPGWSDVVEVTDGRTLADWERVAIEGFPFDDLRPASPGRLVDPRLLADRCFHAWVGYLDGEPVSIGTSYLAHGVNVFTLGVTLPDHRGRGAWQLHARRRLARFPSRPAMGLFLGREPRPRRGVGLPAVGTVDGVVTTP
jgi:hypothetical protein